VQTPDFPGGTPVEKENRLKTAPGANNHGSIEAGWLALPDVLSARAGTVSVGFFLAIGCRQTGQFLRHMFYKCLLLN